MIIALVQFTPFNQMYALGKAHTVLGMIVMTLGLAQPFNGLMRPHIGQKWRKEWEMLHKGSGWFALFLAWPVIFMGIALFASFTPPSVLTDIIGGVFPFMAAVLVFTTIYCVLSSSSAETEKLIKKEVTPVTGVIDPSRKSAAVRDRLSVMGVEQEMRRPSVAHDSSLVATGI